MAVEAVQNGQYHATARAQRELFAPTVPDGISVVERDLWHLDSEDHAWRSQFFSEIPDYLARYFGERYAKIYRDVKKAAAAAPMHFCAPRWAKVYCHAYGW